MGLYVLEYGASVSRSTRITFVLILIIQPVNNIYFQSLSLPIRARDCNQFTTSNLLTVEKINT